METILTTVEDNLLDSLNFSLGSSGKYITERKSVSFYAAGSNIYTPRNGTTLLKFNLTDNSAWLDPSTLRVQFKINNTSSRTLRLLNTNPANFFRRVMIRCNGVLIEDLDYYNRLSNMMSHLMPYHKKFNNMAEGLQTDWMNPIQLDGGQPYYSQFENKNTSPEIQPFESITVQMPLLSGFLACQKYLPLRFLQGLSIELVLVSHHKDAALMLSEHYANPGSEPEWTITEPVIKVQAVTIDNQLENGYVQRLLDGKAMPISYTSFVTQVANAGNTQNPTVSITRAFSRLKSAYISMFKRVYVHKPDGATPEERYRSDECEHLANTKEATFFYHPQYLYNGTQKNTDGDFVGNIDRDYIDKPPVADGFGNDSFRGYYEYNPKCEVSYQVQLGSKVYPVMEVKTSQEAFYELTKTIGAHEMTSTYAVDILPREYRSWKFIMGCSFENAPGTFASGMSTRNGDLLTIKLKGCHHVNNRVNDVTGNQEILPYSVPEQIYVVLEHDAVLNITDAGVSVFD